MLSSLIRHKKKLWAIFSLGLILLVLLFIYNSQKTVEDRIKDGTLSYSQELGWINWNHALPHDTKLAFEKFKSLNAHCDTSFLFRYDQRMGFDCFFLKIKAAHYQIVEVRKIKNNRLALQVFFEIFKSVSASFEKMQSQFPHSIANGRSNSTYRAGDLTGNLISFYCATQPSSLATFKKKFIHQHSAIRIKNIKPNKFPIENWNDLEAKRTPLFAYLFDKKIKTEAKKYITTRKEGLHYSL